MIMMVMIGGGDEDAIYGDGGEGDIGGDGGEDDIGDDNLQRAAMSPATAMPLATCQMIIQTWYII